MTNAPRWRWATVATIAGCVFLTSTMRMCDWHAAADKPIVRIPGEWDVGVIVAARLSPDGKVLALQGLATGRRPVADRTAIWFLQVDDRRVIARTSPGWTCHLPNWADGGGYSMLALEPDKVSGPYWTRSPTRVPTLLLDVGGVAARATDAIVDPAAGWAVLVLPEQRSRTKWSFAVYALPIRQDLVARRIAQGLTITGALGLVRYPGKRTMELAMLVGSPQGCDALEVILVDLASGRIRGEIPLGIPLGIVWPACRYGPEELLLPVEPLDPHSGTQILKVDLAKGTSECIVVVPDSYTFLTTLLTPDGPRTFMGGRSNVWEIAVSPERKFVKEVVLGGGAVSPAGVRVGKDGVEVLMHGSRQVWRCLLRSRRVELLIGEPGGRDVPQIPLLR